MKTKKSCDTCEYCEWQLVGDGDTREKYCRAKNKYKPSARWCNLYYDPVAKCTDRTMRLKAMDEALCALMDQARNSRDIYGDGSHDL